MNRAVKVALFHTRRFRRRTSKSVKKNFEKGIDFSFAIWYTISVRGRGVEPTRPMVRTGEANRRTSSTYRATAEEYSRWGVAVGILNTEDCGEEGNP